MSLIYGVNPVTEAIVSGKTINKIYAQKGNKEVYQVIQKAKEKRIVVVEAEKNKLDRMITDENEKLKNSQGIVASVTDYNYYTIDDILEEASMRNEPPFIIILDKIEDPQNLGAIVRSVECLGAHGVIIQKRNASQVTDTVEKVAAGACNYVKIARVTNITESIKYLKKQGLWIYGLDMEGATDVYSTDLSGSIGIVVGNEGSGISNLVLKNCDGVIKIPMTGNIESLNASVSAAICMYEIVRQKNLKNK